MPAYSPSAAFNRYPDARRLADLLPSIHVCPTCARDIENGKKCVCFPSDPTQPIRLVKRFTGSKKSKVRELIRK